MDKIVQDWMKAKEEIWTKLSRNERKQKKKNGQNCPGMNESKNKKNGQEWTKAKEEKWTKLSRNE